MLFLHAVVFQSRSIAKDIGMVVASSIVHGGAFRMKCEQIKRF
jgi:hypothetical protein